jgi:type IV pilus assembly protein PilV
MLIMKKPMISIKLQHGVMLLEALISILIFSIGILAVIALQANSIKLASDSKYRSDANLLANQLVGEMWVAHTSPTFVGDFSTGGVRYLAWANSSVAATLPLTGVSAPTVTITQATIAAASTVSSTVDINIFWTVPGESPGTASAHRYSTRTQITNN